MTMTEEREGESIKEEMEKLKEREKGKIEGIGLWQ